MPNLSYPARNDVDKALAELEEAEKRRIARALEEVNRQRRELHPKQFTWKGFFWFMVKVVAAAAVIWLVIAGALAL